MYSLLAALACVLVAVSLPASAPAVSVPGLVAADTTPPTIELTSPSAGSTVSHVVSLAATASDDVGVQAVEFFLDGSTSLGVDTTAPYVREWDSTTVSNGAHTLTAVARDAAGNQTTSSGVPTTTTNPAFVNETVVSGVTDATTIAFLPGGRMLIGRLSEKILVVQPGSNQPDPTPFLELDGSLVTAEQGLLDILPDPSFAQNGYYYVFYTHGTSSGNHSRVSRFTASGNGTVPGSEVPLWEDLENSGVGLLGGSLAFGADGKLYISTGEHFDPPDAQRLDKPRGKILRINRDGTIPSDNPFHDGAGPNRDEIWALGLRNPFRMSIDPVTGTMYIGDVGSSDHNSAIEEVNIGVRGANYGWPVCEGPCGVSGMTNPTYSYPHGGRDACVTGGVVYRGSQFPSEYYGSYFFGDYVQHTVRRMKFDGDGNLSQIMSFWPSDGSLENLAVGDPVKLLEGPDGSLYYVDIGFFGSSQNPAAIRRIRYVLGNQQPVASATATPTSGQAPLTVTFSSAGSSDPEGVSLSYSWTFGDGGTSTLANPTHTYQNPGQYVARLTVSDGNSTAVSSDLTIRVGTPPTPTILTPATGTLFRAGDAITFSGSATDTEDGPLPASAFSWTIFFHHDSHIHPGPGPFTNTTSGTLQIPASGHDFEGNTNYEIVLTVTDSTGLTASTSVTVIPDKVDVTYDTVPSGLTVTIDGISRQTPFVVDDLKGFQHTIDAPNQSNGGTAYNFASWSDGGAQSHGIVVPTVDQSYIATFQANSGPGSLVAAYSFNEGAGTSVADASGSGNAGSIGSATWTTAGKYGNALSFNGSSARVTVPDSSSLRLTNAVTLEAWVYPTTVNSAWRDVIYKGSDNYYLEATSSNSGRPVAGGIFGGSYAEAYGTSNLAVNAWTHLAATYDGVTLRLYVNGTQVSSLARSGTIATSNGVLSIGGDPLYGQYFSGRIDEVRIYGAALTQAQVQNDMATPIGGAPPPDTTPPTAPTGLTAAAVSSTQINLSWTQATDNAGILRYRIERCSGAGCSTFSEIATATGTSYSDAGRSPSTSYSYRVRAEDTSNNLGPYSTTASAQTPAAPDTTPPTAPTGLTATAVSSTQINLGWTASSDNVGVTGYRVERCQGVGCSTFVQVATPSGTVYNDTGLQPATSYSYRVRAADAAGNLSGYSSAQNASTQAAPDTQPPTAPTGLSAAGFSLSRINLSWGASSDNVGVAGYRVERCQGTGCSNFVQVATPSGTSYNDTGLQASTSYSYRVRAVDAAGNLSGYSTVANATTFQETAVFTGLTNPTAFEFAGDGRMFVAEKGGRIKVFDSLSDGSPDLFADLSGNVHNFWDRGMLGFALDPGFTTGRPYVYVLYTFDAPIGGSPPTWGDGCPTPPGATGDGCVVSARLSRLTASGNFMAGPEQVLINDWCQQYPSHSIGSLGFGADGALYVSSGDGASFNFADWGQDGSPLNPCGDPPGGVGATLSPPSAEGGALRSQDLRTNSDPTTLDGAILRVDPDTGQALPNNPNAASPDANARRIIAHGLRNPFRFTIRPGTSEVWLGDVGWNTWEEVDRIADPLGSVENFGWPCYEGNGSQSGYDSANLTLCENLYALPGGVMAPYYTYNHSAQVVAGETCPTGSSSIAGLAFYTGGPFPDSYDGALFFADYSRDCIWVMFPGGNGLPNASNRATFQAPAANPVALKVGPDGALYYADFDGGTIRRIASSANQPPIASATASPTNGSAPLLVNFDGGGSSDPEGGSLNYAWDLDADGAFDDSTAVAPTYTYSIGGTYNVRLRVTDNQGASSVATVQVSVNNTPPVASIDAPSLGSTWRVGDTIAFIGSATDAEQGTSLPPSAFAWDVVLQHCPSNCHSHTVQTFPGVKSGSFAAPDHEYPSYLELRLTVTDAGGLTDSKTLRLDPRTVELSFQSSPSGLQLVVGGSSSTTPFTRTVIEGSSNSISASSPQLLGGTSYTWVSWSDGGAQSHNIVADAAGTYTATYQADTQPPTVPAGLSAAAVSSTQINLIWTASTDNLGVTGYQLERCEGAGCSNFTQVATPTGTTHNDTGLTPSTSYSYRVRAVDAAGNLSGYSIVQSATTQAMPSNLVAAYSFNEGSGTTVVDASGRANAGAIANVTWTTAGKFGNALSFNGSNALVTVADAPSLRLTTGMTLEAWVNPSVVNRAWRDVIYKGDDNYYLEATSSRNTAAPVGGGSFGDTWASSALAANTWSHLAVTYDKQTLRLYVNGVQVASRPRTQDIATSANPLQIGGDSLYGQFFQGTIDEVRVYNTALTAAQIQADMNAPLGLIAIPQLG